MSRRTLPTQAVRRWLLGPRLDDSPNLNGGFFCPHSCFHPCHFGWLIQSDRRPLQKPTLILEESGLRNVWAAPIDNAKAQYPPPQLGEPFDPRPGCHQPEDHTARRPLMSILEMGNKGMLIFELFTVSRLYAFLESVKDLSVRGRVGCSASTLCIAMHI